MKDSSELGVVESLKELGKLFKENPILIVTTLVAMVIGAIFRCSSFL